jgi:hypothetical protein
MTDVYKSTERCLANYVPCTPGRVKKHLVNLVQRPRDLNNRTCDGTASAGMGYAQCEVGMQDQDRVEVSSIDITVPRKSCGAIQYTTADGRFRHNGRQS